MPDDKKFKDYVNELTTVTTLPDDAKIISKNGNNIETIEKFDLIRTLQDNIRSISGNKIWYADLLTDPRSSPDVIGDAFTQTGGGTGPNGSGAGWWTKSETATPPRPKSYYRISDGVTDGILASSSTQVVPGYSLVFCTPTITKVGNGGSFFIEFQAGTSDSYYLEFTQDTLDILCKLRYNSKTANQVGSTLVISETNILNHCFIDLVCKRSSANEGHYILYIDGVPKQIFIDNTSRTLSTSAGNLKFHVDNSGSNGYRVDFYYQDDFGIADFLAKDAGTVLDANTDINAVIPLRDILYDQARAEYDLLKKDAAILRGDSTTDSALRVPTSITINTDNATYDSTNDWLELQNSTLTGGFKNLIYQNVPWGSENFVLMTRMIIGTTTDTTFSRELGIYLRNSANQNRFYFAWVNGDPLKIYGYAGGAAVTGSPVTLASDVFRYGKINYLKIQRLQNEYTLSLNGQVVAYWDDATGTDNISGNGRIAIITNNNVVNNGFIAFLDCIKKDL